MSTQQKGRHKDRTVGTRLRAEVEEAHSALDAAAAGPDRQTQLSRGVLTGYLWALGRGEDAPITGARIEGPPDIPQLTAEVDAATVQLEDTTQRTVPRDFIRGVHDALAWVCGHSDDRP
ncbi:hypothetical protein NLX86_19190 [Streptomyces sp. A3M-1-3]|uniref:hypothetical protein n=1 Tax=Streptomyces sp. A3M-1-3 TaxID=2962044 RepID=UPI0020B7ED83|nr:hypothetical protein [Streptomyces sp. A3M-1-3]MCP3820145.1 hypothetical protein [Streptomyces sp. A3M-1-3]